jgi:hypothetical protein
MAVDMHERAQLIDMIVKLQNATYKTEAERDALLTELERRLPNSEISDLIFWNDPDLSAEEIVDTALQRAGKR